MLIQLQIEFGLNDGGWRFRRKLGAFGGFFKLRLTRFRLGKGDVLRQQIWFD